MDSKLTAHGLLPALALTGMLTAPSAAELVMPAPGALEGAAVLSDDAIVSPSMLQDVAPPAEVEKEWKSRFTLGVAASGGNTDSQSVNAGVTSQREDDESRTKLDAFYYYGASNGDRDENKFTAGILHDWLLPDSKWFLFASGRFDYDEFQSWEYRVSGHGGVGYELVREDDLDVTLRAGLGAVREFNSPNEDVRLEGLFGGDLEWRITDKQTFTAGSTIYPDFDDTGEFRTLSYASWALLMDEETNLSLNVRFEHEHQSLVGSGVDKNDFRVVAGVQLDF